MKVKYVIVVALLLLFAVAFSQIFTIPPRAEDIFVVYKSGYFSELDREFDIIKDSFIETKMLGTPAYGWILLEDIQARHAMRIRVYNASGCEVKAPGKAEPSPDEAVLKIINSLSPGIVSAIAGRKYQAALPVFIEDRCRFCHEGAYQNNVVGVMTFERAFDAHIYYTSERIVIFTIISLATVILLVLVLRWEPGRKVKELFDK